MDIYKQGVIAKVRFNTSKGSLSIEQLYELSQTDLANVIKSQKQVLKKTDEGELGFLDEISKVDAKEQLKFDILKEVYLTKKSESEALRNAKEIKEHNQKIMELISNKQESELLGKSVDELKTLLR